MAPLGEPGSGYARYGAAMTLYELGQIGPDTLEVFRACAPDDSADPRAELIRLGITQDIPMLDTCTERETAP